MNYKVILKSKVKFSACHFIVEHFKCSRLHGHNFYVSVEILGKLNEKYFVVDFMELGEKLKQIVEPLDHRILIPIASEVIKVQEIGDSVEVIFSNKKYLLPKEDTVFLPIPATTSELLAKYIHDELKKTYSDNKISVKVGESLNSIACFED
ncbi:MAG: 6-pyruvoyl trahydropterin synthase family protein [Promethearchaeia archaeon]